MKCHDIAVALIVALMLAGCASSEEASTLSVGERLARAKQLYDDGDYTDAINEFTVITLQFQGSAEADDAQFYLGETRFAREEFLLASFEYQQLIRNMPASPLVPDARFKIGLCYYRLSPKSSLDQQYTTKAIDELQSYVEYHPGHAHASEAETLLRELTTRLAKKSFEIAQQYAILEYYRSAAYYFDEVIEKYHDTEYAPLAYLEKTEVLIARRRYDEAQRVLATFFEKFPDSEHRWRAEALRREIDEKLMVTSPRGMDAERTAHDNPG